MAGGLITSIIEDVRESFLKSQNADLHLLSISRTPTKTTESNVKAGSGLIKRISVLDRR